MLQQEKIESDLYCGQIILRLLEYYFFVENISVSRSVLSKKLKFDI